MRRTTGDSALILPLVESIYDAVTAVERWPGRARGDLQRRRWRGLEPGYLRLHEPGGGASHVFGVDPERVRTYGDYYAAKNILIQRARPLLASGAVVVASDYLTRSEVDKSEYHNDFLGPMGLGDAAGACIFLERSTMTQLSVFRPVGGDSFGPRDASLLRGLVPHFQRAQSIQRRLAAVEQRESALDGALDCLDRALVVLDERGRPLATNLAARRILESGDSLVLSNQGLRARRHSDDQKLQRLIRSALDCRTRPELAWRRRAERFTQLLQGADRRPGAARRAPRPTARRRAGLPRPIPSASHSRPPSSCAAVSVFPTRRRGWFSASPRSPACRAPPPAWESDARPPAPTSAACSAGWECPTRPSSSPSSRACRPLLFQPELLTRLADGR